MSAPTGEATNYELALATVDALIADAQHQVDAAEAAIAAVAQAKAAVDAMQQTYAAAAQAAATKLDQEGAASLDSTTMGHAGTTVDAMPVNAVDDLYAQMEVTEQMAVDRRDASGTALASLEAERQHLVATYADAHATVAQNLSGNAGFLDSGGGGATASAGAAAAA